MIPELGWPAYLIVFLFGSAVGSFLNVVIHRVPLDESIVFPGSRCPNCKRPIKPHENIPILSYLILRGRCAGCKTVISPRYPAIEAAMGGLALLAYSRFGFSADLLIYAALSAILLALSMIDLATFRLPNPITLTGAIIAIVLTLIFKRDLWLEMLAGGLMGLGLLGFMGLIGRLIFRKETLGMGDVKLAGMIGLFLGPWKTAGMFIIGVFLGALLGGAILLLAGRKGWGQRIPFGPYLAAGALISLYWSEPLLKSYLSIVLP